MATYSLDVSIDNNKFGGLGNPITMTDPAELKSKFPNVTKQVLEEYKSVYNSIHRDRSLLTRLDKQFGSYDNVIASKDMFNINLPYEKGIPHTYKFLGMNVNTDFQSVIPVGDGYVVVAEMFDRDKIKKVTNLDAPGLRSVDSTTAASADDFIDKCNEDVIRRLATSMKTGALYEMYQKVSERAEKGDTKVNITDLLGLIEVAEDDLNSTIGMGYDPNIKSIALNLARVKEEDKQEALAKGSSNNNGASVAATVIIKCFGYWKDVIETYTAYNRLLSAVDLWSNIAKKVMGDDAFNRDARTSFNAIDTQTGQYVGGTLAVVGVARNGSISDSDVLRAPIASGLSKMGNIIAGRSDEITLDNLSDIMMGNIETDAFDNPYDLSASELQAVSNYDSLQIVDEDAKISASSYNLDDPEERGLFLKSAVKSYEKNFREYKPTNHYLVTDAMAELVENGESFKELLVPEVEYVDPNIVVPGYITTDTPEQLEIKLTRRNLLKVSKLVDKSLKSVIEMF